MDGTDSLEEETVSLFGLSMLEKRKWQQHTDRASRALRRRLSPVLVPYIHDVTEQNCTPACARHTVRTGWPHRTSSVSIDKQDRLSGQQNYRCGLRALLIEAGQGLCCSCPCWSWVQVQPVLATEPLGPRSPWHGITAGGID
jgi:hypothetical protein